MRTLFLTALWLGSLCMSSIAQDAVPLTATLPNGKVVRFESAEQKAKFEAAQQRMAQSPAVTPAPSSVLSPAPVGSVADASAESGSGRASVHARMFTAEYYMSDPASWLGKSVSLSVAYVNGTVHTAEGHRVMTAVTWSGNTPRVFDLNLAGKMDLLVKQDQTFNMRNLCGTRLQMEGARIKTVLVKGTFSKAKYGPPRQQKEHFCVVVDHE